MTAPRSSSTGGEHTALPWSFVGSVKPVGGEHVDHLWCGDIIPPKTKAYRGEIASIQSADHITYGITREEAAANAAFIVRAVNSHQPMIDALREAREALLTLNHGSDSGLSVVRGGKPIREIIDEALAGAAHV